MGVHRPAGAIVKAWIKADIHLRDEGLDIVATTTETSLNLIFPVATMGD